MSQTQAEEDVKHDDGEEEDASPAHSTSPLCETCLAFLISEVKQEQVSHKDEADADVDDASDLLRAAAFFQWALVLLGLLAIALVAGGFEITTDLVCATNATNASFAGTDINFKTVNASRIAPFHFGKGKAFERETTKSGDPKSVPFIETQSHIYACTLVMCVAATALVLSGELTFWRQLAMLRLAAASERRKETKTDSNANGDTGAATADTSAAVSRPASRQGRNGNTSFDSGMGDADGTGPGPTACTCGRRLSALAARHNGRRRRGSKGRQSISTDEAHRGSASANSAFTLPGLVRHPSSSTASPINRNSVVSPQPSFDDQVPLSDPASSTPHPDLPATEDEGSEGREAQQKRWRRSLTKSDVPRVLWAAWWLLRAWTWVGFSSASGKRATLPQWLLFATTFTSLYMLTGVAVKNAIGLGVLQYLIPPGVALIGLALGSLLQHLQRLLVARFRHAHKDTSEKMFVHMISVGGSILLAQVFLFCFLVAYAYSTTPCFPRWNAPIYRGDAQFVSSLLYQRFWGTMDLALHLTFLNVWWLMEVCMGRMSVSRLLRLKQSRVSTFCCLLVVLASAAAVANFSNVFAEQPALFLFDDGLNYFPPSLTFALSIAVFVLWGLVFLTLMAATIHQRLGLVKEPVIGYILISYVEEDAPLANRLLEQLQSVCRDKFPHEQVIPLRFSARDIKLLAASLHSTHHGAHHTSVAAADAADAPDGGEEAARRAAELRQILEQDGVTRIFVPLLTWHRDGGGGSVQRLCSSTSGRGDDFFLELVLAQVLLDLGVLQSTYSILSGGLPDGSVYYDSFFSHYRPSQLASAVPLLIQGLVPALQRHFSATSNSSEATMSFSQLVKSAHSQAWSMSPSKYSPQALLTGMLQLQAFLISEHGVPERADAKAMESISDVFVTVHADRAANASHS
ncbi:hypothetical protein PTSG_11225 [Salpingoeca rosetta]|uniref:Transmembrane protein n=1 Tax=Salpingoeca rosetta (strain ATCC 50818 / BSB-021) TaxID=946362 RepID=F2USS9_SALR5|nr:uncharacterized protein PTSG_11225 [Salpingoeca rosetta]EGD81188.1 hypothetical protein PTSG_11225 [Salpingoeca rosetta]|eukprot:XP_004987723.1 hypothetical protein PTSG_11225 [Salpingoeca rosetta]